VNDSQFIHLVIQQGMAGIITAAIVLPLFRWMMHYVNRTHEDFMTFITNHAAHEQQMLMEIKVVLAEIRDALNREG
jgi:hypothetical protein